MSTQTLSSVAQNVVGQYSQAGKIIVGAYRSGAEKLVGGVNARYASFVNSRALPLVNDAFKASLIELQTKFAEAVVGGINAGTGRAEQAIDLLAGGVSGGIQRVNATAGRVESAFNTTALTSVGQLSMPVAQVSLEIAKRAVAGTKRLSARVVGAEAEVEQVVVTAKRAVKRVAKKAVRGAKARA
jgi:hypothetical protein